MGPAAYEVRSAMTKFDLFKRIGEIVLFIKLLYSRERLPVTLHVPTNQLTDQKIPMIDDGRPK